MLFRSAAATLVSAIVPAAAQTPDDVTQYVPGFPRPAMCVTPEGVLCQRSYELDTFWSGPVPWAKPFIHATPAVQGVPTVKILNVRPEPPPESGTYDPRPAFKPGPWLPPDPHSKPVKTQPAKRWW